MCHPARWVSGSNTLLLIVIAAGSIAPAAAGPGKPFEPQAVQFPFEGVGGIAEVDRPGQGPGSVATTLFGGDAIALVRTGRGAPAAGDRYAVGDGPFSLVAGDLDHDRRDDLVVLNFWSVDLSVLMARPGGGFAAERRQPLPSGMNPDDLDTSGVRPMALADFDKDGCLDLALVTRPGIEMLLGDCRGGFGTAVRVVTDYFHASLVSADFDLDGNADLVAVHTSTDDAVVLLGRGDGTFAGLPAVLAGILSRGLATGDLNGDGLPDLVTANGLAGDQREPDGDISVLLGAGGGLLRPAVRYRAGRSTFAVTLGDFDRDGDLDIAAGNFGSSDASIFAGHGDGTFGGERRTHIGKQPQEMRAIDTNLDGALDLVASVSQAGVGFVTGRGDGTFDAPDSVPQPLTPGSLAAADLNGDGHQDLIVAGNHPVDITGEVSILPGTGEGRFAPAITFNVKPWGESPGVAAADLNEDGLGDLVLLDTFSVGVLLGRPGWTFSPAEWMPTALRPTALAIADFDRDRHLDLAVAHDNGAGIAIFLGRGDGGFRAGVSLPGDTLYHVSAGDLDGDGVIDLAAGGWRFDPATGYHDGVLVWKGDGRGGFGASLLLDLRETPRGLGLGDIDGDRRADIVTATSFEVIHFRNLGGGAFGPAVPTPSGSGVSSLVVADITHDGLADAITLESGTEFIAVLGGSRDGTLRDVATTVAGHRPQAIVAADFDGDGDVDLATADRGERDAFVGSHPGVTLLMNRARTSARPVAIDAPASLRSVPPRRQNR